jgi:hypothetical protein
VSYVLLTNGALHEYKDADGRWTFIDSNVASIDAGTDKIGVNTVAEVTAGGTAWTHSDSSGWHYLGTGVRSVSAGQQGILDILYTNGNAYWYNEATGSTSFLASNVAAVTTGTDQYGNYMIDLLYNSGMLSEYQAGRGWTFLDYGVQSISKGRAGLVDVVFNWGDAYSHDAYEVWHYLTRNARAAA